VRTHNDFAPLVPIPEWAPSAELQADFDAGRQFEDEAFAELARIHPGTADRLRTSCWPADDSAGIIGANKIGSAAGVSVSAPTALRGP
jgi:hypothetical protein